MNRILNRNYNNITVIRTEYTSLLLLWLLLLILIDSSNNGYYQAREFVTSQTTVLQSTHIKSIANNLSPTSQVLYQSMIQYRLGRSRGQRRNNLTFMSVIFPSIQICPRRGSNSGGSGLQSTARGTCTLESSTFCLR